MNPEDFAALRTIAKGLKTTNQRLGQLLAMGGFRDRCGHATKLAYENEMVLPYTLHCGISSELWHSNKVVEYVNSLEKQHPGILTPKKIPNKKKGIE